MITTATGAALAAHAAVRSAVVFIPSRTRVATLRWPAKALSPREPEAGTVVRATFVAGHTVRGGIANFAVGTRSTIYATAVHVGFIAVLHTIAAMSAGRLANERTAGTLARTGGACGTLAALRANLSVAARPWAGLPTAVALPTRLPAAARRAGTLPAAADVPVLALVIRSARATVDTGTKGTARGIRCTEFTRRERLVMNQRGLMQDQGFCEKGSDVAGRHIRWQRDRSLRCHQDAAEGALNRYRRRGCHAEQNVHVAWIDVHDRATEREAVLDVDEYGTGRIVDVEERLRIQAQ